MWRVWATDAAGNNASEPCAAVNLTIDTQPPVTAVLNATSATNGSYASHQLETWWLVGWSEPLSVIRAVLSGAAGNSTAWFIHPPKGNTVSAVLPMAALGLGLQSLELTGMDVAGNAQSAALVVRWTYLGPVVSVLPINKGATRSLCVNQVECA